MCPSVPPVSKAPDGAAVSPDLAKCRVASACGMFARPPFALSFRFGAPGRIAPRKYAVRQGRVSPRAPTRWPGDQTSTMTPCERETDAGGTVSCKDLMNVFLPPVLMALPRLGTDLPPHSFPERPLCNIPQGEARRERRLPAARVAVATPTPLAAHDLELDLRAGADSKSRRPPCDLIG